MNVNTGSNQKRTPQKKRKGNNVSLIKVAGLTALLLLLILSAAFFLNNKIPSAPVGDKEETDIFYSINSDNLKSIVPFSDGVALLSASSLKYLDARDFFSRAIVLIFIIFLSIDTKFLLVIKLFSYLSIASLLSSMMAYSINIASRKK